MTKDTINRIVSGVIGLVLIGVGVYLLTVEQDEWGAAVIFGGLGTLGLRPVLGAGPKGPPDQGAGGASALLVACLVAASTLSTACGAPAQQRAAHEVLNGVTAIADPTYRLAVDGCDAARDAIIAREGTTYEADLAAMTQVNEVCDGIVLGFETLRDTELTARAAIDGGLSAAAAAAIQQALDLWPRLQALVPQLATLGQTAGGESP